MCIWMWGYAFVLEVREVTESYVYTLFILHTYVGGKERGIYVCNFFPSSWNKNNLGAGHEDENCLLEGECVRI